MANSSFRKNIFVLVGGTAGGQLILILIAPLLTRLYTPADFGVLAIYTACLSILVTISSLRYDFAILAARNREESIQLVVISFIVLTFTFLFLLIILSIIGQDILDFFNLDIPFYFIYFFTFSLLGLSSYGILNKLAIRKKKYNLIARTKFVQSFVLGMFQLIIGLFFTKAGLLLGDVFGRFSGVAGLGKTIEKREVVIIKRQNIKSLWAIMKHYKNYPMYSTTSSLLNNGILQTPPLILAVAYGDLAVGFFALVQRIVGVPMKLLGASIADVYIGEVASLREKPKEIVSILNKIVIRLVIIGFLPFIISYLYAPFLFGVVFGDDWKIAGEYLKILSLMYLVQFSIFPITQTLEVLGKQKLEMLWQFLRGGLVIMSLVIPIVLNYSIENTLSFYGISMIVSYIAIYLVILKSLRNKKGSIS